ncbi:hypothetical protein BJX64DRAFT_36885 [Aspergillus heterothallicus]
MADKASSPSTALADVDVLLAAIRNASDDRVRSILRDVCTASTEAQQIAAEKLLVDASKKQQAQNTGTKAAPDFTSCSHLDSLRSISGGRDELPPLSAPGPGQAQVTLPPFASLDPTRQKRVVPRYSFCPNCKQEFDVTENTSTACTFHPLDCEPTGDDLWVDNDFGIEDTPSLRERYPDCYEFECCGETLADNPRGCETGWHKEGAYERPQKVYRTFNYQPSF